MYAAIDDPNNHVDLYTSGSETYAQIQPQLPLTVAVEINTAPTSSRPNEEDGNSSFILSFKMGINFGFSISNVIKCYICNIKTSKYY